MSYKTMFAALEGTSTNAKEVELANTALAYFNELRERMDQSDIKDSVLLECFVGLNQVARLVEAFAENEDEKKRERAVSFRMAALKETMAALPPKTIAV